MPVLQICLIILHIREAFEDALGCKYTRGLSMARMYMQGSRRVPNMSGWGSMVSKMPKYVLMFFNMPEHGWILLNIFEFVLLNVSEHFGVLNMRRYSYNNIIIIVANIIMLAFLSVWFIYPVALLPFHLF